jgi:hypothetical protein
LRNAASVAAEHSVSAKEPLTLTWINGGSACLGPPPKADIPSLMARTVSR